MLAEIPALVLVVEESEGDLMTAGLIYVVSTCLMKGETTVAIRAKIMAEGLSEEQAFLVFKAAQFYLARC